LVAQIHFGQINVIINVVIVSTIGRTENKKNNIIQRFNATFLIRIWLLYCHIRYLFIKTSYYLCWRKGNAFYFDLFYWVSDMYSHLWQLYISCGWIYYTVCSITLY